MERVLADIDADSLGCLRHGVLLVFGAPCQLKTLAEQERGRTIPLADIDRNRPTGRASIVTILDPILDRRACSILHTRLPRLGGRVGKPPLTMQASSLDKIVQSQKETVEAVPFNKEAHAVCQIYGRLLRRT
jgi:hypothetical protein